MKQSEDNENGGKHISTRLQFSKYIIRPNGFSRSIHLLRKSFPGRIAQSPIPKRRRTADRDQKQQPERSSLAFVDHLVYDQSRWSQAHFQIRVPGNVMAPELDFNQLRAFSAFKRGYPVALLGGAGSEKSFLLTRILEEAKKKHGENGILACAWTNHAAHNIGGRTIHALFGVRSGFPFDKEKLWTCVEENEALRETLVNIRAIFVDEISILKAKVLDAIDWVMRHTAKNERLACMPIGGRQLIVAGDPFQLEPISVNYDVEGEGQAFSARTWMLTFGGFGSGVIALLKGNHRQGNDSTFYDILTRIRQGCTTLDDIHRINSTSSSCQAVPRTHTVLCLLRKQVSEVNTAGLARIPGPPKCVTAKQGCAVILTRSSGKIVPGTRATVISVAMFSKGRNSRLLTVDVRVDGQDQILRIKPVQFEINGQDASVLAYREQLPIFPAYALTVHKSQGLKVRRVAMDFGKVGRWVPAGMAYVALSRCTDLAGLWVPGLEQRHINVKKHAMRLMDNIMKLKMHFIHRMISGTGAASITVNSETS